MFGKSDKDDNLKTTVFDLEGSLKQNPAKKKEFVDEINGKMDSLKTILRNGENKKEFEQFAFLLQGYAAAIKVADRL